MRARTRPMLGLLLMTALLAACARTAPAPVPEAAVEEGPAGAFRLTSTGRTASAAVESGLNQAMRHCAARNAMISVDSTRIEPRGYQIGFRCLEAGQAPETVALGAPAAPAAGDLAPATPSPVPMATQAVLAAPAAEVQAQAPRPTSTSQLPGAARALTPIAAGRPPAPVAASAPATPTAPIAQPPSSFWSFGR